MSQSKPGKRKAPRKRGREESGSSYPCASPKRAALDNDNGEDLDAAPRPARRSVRPKTLSQAALEAFGNKCAALSAREHAGSASESESDGDEAHCWCKKKDTQFMQRCVSARGCGGLVHLRCEAIQQIGADDPSRSDFKCSRCIDTERNETSDSERDDSDHHASSCEDQPSSEYSDG